MRSGKGHDKWMDLDRHVQQLGGGKVQGQVQRIVKGSQKEAVMERQAGGPEQHGIQRGGQTSWTIGSH